MSTLVARFFKFATVGLISTAIHYSILTLLVELIRAGVVLATTVGFIAGATANYLLNRRFTFESHAKHEVALPKFLSVAVLGIAMNAAIVAWLSTTTVIHYLIAQMCATGTVLMWNFTANAIWTFRSTKSARSIGTYDGGVKSRLVRRRTARSRHDGGQ